MIGIVKRYVCDSCKKVVCVDPEAEAEGWTRTEVGDLCPSCVTAWENYKESFVVQMRKENKQSVM